MIMVMLSNANIIIYCQAPGPGPGPFMVLAWSYPGLAPFLVKTGPGVDTIIKQTTTTPPPPHHKLFLGSSLFEPVFRQVLMKPRNFFSYLHVFTENDS